MNKLLYIVAATALLTSTVHLFQSGDVNLYSLQGQLAQTNSLIEKFQQWKSQYGRVYENNEFEAYRMAIFVDNLNMINEHNTKANARYEMGVNQFMDITQEEFVATYLTLETEAKWTEEAENDAVLAPGAYKAVDWVAQGFVSPVKNQGNCGSCYAFSVVGGLESSELQNKLGKTTFSEQQIVDCTKLSGNLGCNGGSLLATYQWVKKHGITDDTSYKYVAKGGTCKQQGGKFHIEGYQILSVGCPHFREAIEGRPVSVAVDATNWSFYKKGVFDNCGVQLNHGVLLVGLNDNGEWHIKNSWGTAWGDNGYITLAPGDTCGVCIQGFYPTNPFFEK